MGRNTTFYFATLLLFSLEGLAANNVPSECFVSKANGTVKSLPCVGFVGTVKDLIGNLSGATKSIKNVCLFNRGLWQRGTLIKSSSTNTISFVSKISCDRGIAVTKAPQTAEIIGPSVTTCRKLGSKFNSADCDANATYATPLHVSELYDTAKYPGGPYAPLNCFRKARSTTGTSGEPRICSTDAQAAGYCEIVPISGDNPKVTGSWWVQYQEAKQKKAKICLGGVSVASLGAIQAEYENKDVDFSITKQIMQTPLGSIGSSTAPVQYHLAFSLDDPNKDEAVTGCLVQKNLGTDFSNKNLKKIECSKECSAQEQCATEINYGSGETLDKRYYPEFLNETSETAEKNICFKDKNGYWYMVMKRMTKLKDTYLGVQYKDYGGALDGVYSNQPNLRRCYQIEVKSPR